MPKKHSNTVLVPSDGIESLVRIIRGQRVMLDSDLARLYGVTTMRLNEQVARNRDRFPDDFAYQLTQQEFTSLISQIAISKRGAGRTTQTPLGFYRARRGNALRRAAIPDSGAGEHRNHADVCPVAAAAGYTPGELVEQIARLAETVKVHDERINAIAEVLQRMMEPPAEPRRRIGFPIPGEEPQP